MRRIMTRDRTKAQEGVGRAAASEPVAPSLRQARHNIGVQTRGQSMAEITREIGRWLLSLGASDGLLTVFLAHTSASLTIQENADPDVQGDLLDALKRLAPEGPYYRHSMEGPDDMPAHIKSMLTSTSLSIPVIAGSMALGTWQGVYVIEHRSGSHMRRVELHFIGSMAA
jgi:secondary thiamine-phosphate synthase enzyme